MTINDFFLAIVAHRGPAIDDLVFALIDGDLHHLPESPPSLQSWPSAEPRACILHRRTLGTNHQMRILTASLLAVVLEKEHPDPSPAAQAVPQGQCCCLGTEAL